MRHNKKYTIWKSLLLMSVNNQLTSYVLFKNNK
jgi:hypothetical protein